MTEAPEVICDEEHVYSQNGIVCPRSATGLLKRYGLTMDFSKVPSRILATARQRGKAVAVGCKLIATGQELDANSVDQRIAGYLKAFTNFWRESGARLIETEVPRISPLGFGFTPDLICWLQGRRAVVDGKATFKLPKSVGPQTALYKMGWNSLFPKEPVEDRLALWLKKDGAYKLSVLDDPDDGTAGLDCLEADLKLDKWRLKYGN